MVSPTLPCSKPWPRAGVQTSNPSPIQHTHPSLPLAENSEDPIGRGVGGLSLGPPFKMAAPTVLWRAVIVTKCEKENVISRETL